MSIFATAAWPLVTTAILGLLAIAVIRAFLGLFAADPALVLYLKTLAVTGSLGGLISGFVGNDRRFILATYDPNRHPRQIECGAIADALIGIGGAWGIFFVLARSMRLGSAVEDQLTLIGLGIVAGFSARALLATLRERVLGEARSVAIETAKETVKAQAKASETYTDMSLVTTLVKVSDAAQQPEVKKQLLDSAESQAMEVLSREPNNASALILLGAVKKRRALIADRSEAKNALLDEGIKLCSRVIELRPSDAVGYYNRACYRCLRGAPLAEVLADIDKAIELMPEVRGKLRDEGDFDAYKGDATFRARWA